MLSLTNAPRALLIEVVTPAAVDWVPLAGVGTHCVDAHLAPLARPYLAYTLIDV